MTEVPWSFETYGRFILVLLWNASKRTGGWNVGPEGDLKKVLRGEVLR